MSRAFRSRPTRPYAPRARRVWAALAVAFIGLGTGLGSCFGPGTVDADEDATILQLREQLALAEEGVPYLVLAPSAGTLTLYFGGSPVRSWPVEHVEAGPRRIRVPRPGLDKSWHVRLWTGGRVDPPVVRERRTIVSDSVDAPDLTGADPWIPPAPEEATPGRPRFVVHYDGGLGFEVVSSNEGMGTWKRIRGALRLPGSPWDRYLVRVVMPADEAGALYRSYPADAPLLLRMPAGPR